MRGWMRHGQARGQIRATSGLTARLMTSRATVALLGVLLSCTTLTAPALAQSADASDRAATRTPVIGTQSTEASDDPALLIADTVLVEGEDRLVATGNVEALQGQTRLMASSIIYDRATDTLKIEGPIRIVDPENDVILLASEAELDQGFRNGLLKGARMVIDQHLQLAAVEGRRVEGRYTELSRAALTSCQVCGPDQTPLWQIRASRVVHDKEERQIYLDNAQFRLLDVPIFWAPRLRLPDPTLKRARGFLFPTFTSSTLLGFGVKLPYFIPIGDHQDLTLSPYFTTNSTSLDFRYRRAFRTGGLTITGAASTDDIRDEQLRGYAFADGFFALPRDYTLAFSLKAVSDDAYLNDYGITTADRLANTLSVQRIRPDRRVTFALESYQTLRAYEANATQPGIVANIDTDRRFFFPRLPGEFRISGEVTGLYRESDLAFDSTDADTITDGRDVAHFNFGASWQNRWTIGPGLRAGANAYLFLDHYVTDQDNAVPNHITNVTPAASVELRYPLQRVGRNGGRTLFEPVVQLGWTGSERSSSPNANEESTRVEFDEANLLALSRYPAGDRREHGATVAAGLRWMHQAPSGWSAALTVGRLWREDDDPEFTRSSGLDSVESDWLIAGRFANPMGITLTARGLLDEQGDFSKAEGRAGWSNDRMDLGLSYALLVADPAEARNDTVSEWSFDGRYKITKNWRTSTAVRYDLVDQRLDRVALGLQYRNECIRVNMGATREFASATNLEPSTDIDLTVSLLGFGVDDSAKEYRRTCR